MLICAAIFGVIGVVTLLASFAATKSVTYFGQLTAAKPSVTYTLTMGAGSMHVDYSNNTADVLLTITKKSGELVGKLPSKGATDVSLDAEVTSGTYLFKLTTTARFTSMKGYKIKISYPDQTTTTTTDTTPPSAIISAPLNLTEVSGSTAFSAIATDTSGISKVDFFVNSVMIGTDTISPYSVAWDTTKNANGTATVSVKSYDGKGNIGEGSGTVNVKNAPIGVTRRFPGDPNPKVTGKAYWGSSIGGNGDPAKHETPTGTSLAIHRTFWSWAQATSLTSGMYTTVKDDLDNNRLPFISIKDPGWAAVGNGQYNTQIDSILKKLDSYGKPVWFVVHHEPEGGGGSNSPDDPGGPAAWRSMQKMFRSRMTAVGTKNIAFMPILMSYTWGNTSGRNPEDWWVPGIWDAYIVDHYRDNVSGDMFTQQWTSFVQWIEAKGLPYGTGEWGNRGTDAVAAAEMQAFWDWGFTNKKDVIAHTYFDSGLNSPSGSWELQGAQLTKFQEILKSDRRVQRINDL